MNREIEENDAVNLDHGRALISLWSELFRSFRESEGRSEHVISCGEQVRSLLGQVCSARGGADFAIRGGTIYFDGAVLPECGPRATAYRTFARLMRISRVRAFHIGSQVELGELLGFAERLLRAAEGRGSREEIVAGLKPGGESAIEVVIGSPRDESAIPETGNASQKQAYFSAIGVVKSVFHEVRTKNRINAKRLKRTVQELIDSVHHDPLYALRLTCIKGYDEYTFNHSVNVALLAISLGRAVGLSRSRLYCVGQAALMHDLGKFSVPRHVLNKLNPLSPEERRLLHDHPVEGLFSIASRLGVNSDTIDIAMAAYEHHLNVDGTGYPAQATSRPPGFLSRLIAISDRYDAMTSARIYRAHPIPPQRALALMYHAQGSQIDRTLLGYFMNMLGPYPPGGAVRLSDSSIAVVMEAAADSEHGKFPKVCIAIDEHGERVSGEVRDLSATAKDPDGVHIVEVLETAEYQIDPAQHLT